MPKIQPTVGRNIHYFQALTEKGVIRSWAGKPLVALICGVLDNGNVNLAVFGSDGSGPYARQDVRIVQEGEPHQDGVSFAAWMDYQVGQAAKTEQLEHVLSNVPLESREAPPAHPYAGTTGSAPLGNSDTGSTGDGAGPSIGTQNGPDAEPSAVQESPAQG